MISDIPGEFTIILDELDEDEPIMAKLYEDWPRLSANQCRELARQLLLAADEINKRERERAK